LTTDTEVQQQGPKPRRFAPSQQNAQGERRYPGNTPPPRKACPFCKDKNLQLDYKRYDMLQKYITERGKIQPRRATGVCAKHQRALSLAIKRARHLALLPFTAAHFRKS